VSVPSGRLSDVAERPPVSEQVVLRLGAILSRFPQVREENAWVGTRWRVRQATVAHVFGGEDQLFRITFRAEMDEVLAFQHLGPRYFKAGWGSNVVGMLIDEETDWNELTELLTDSYCLQAPAGLASTVPRPPSPRDEGRGAPPPLRRGPVAGGERRLRSPASGTTP
jgi:YjbR protein